MHGATAVMDIKAEPSGDVESKVLKRVKDEPKDVVEEVFSVVESSSNDKYSSFSPSKQRRVTRSSARARVEKQDSAWKAEDAKEEKKPRSPNKAKKTSTSREPPKIYHRRLNASRALHTIGEPMGETKDALIRSLIRPGGNQNTSFQKMSGLLEWMDATFLFINIDSDDYDNMFLSMDDITTKVKEKKSGSVKRKKGTKDQRDVVSWFASTRHSVDSPCIQRLIHSNCGRDGRTQAQPETQQTVMEVAVKEEPEESDDEGVVEANVSTNNDASIPRPVWLFCRPQRRDVPKGESVHYVNCGRLQYLNHEPSHPIKFYFRLSDFGAVQNSEEFRRLMSIAASKY